MWVPPPRTSSTANCKPISSASCLEVNLGCNSSLHPEEILRFNYAAMREVVLIDALSVDHTAFHSMIGSEMDVTADCIPETPLVADISRMASVI
jgi:hypothetical protein